MKLQMASIVIFVVTLIVGCGEARVPMYPVSGKVVFSDGSPVRTGTVELESIDQQTTASGTIQNDGTFVLGTYESSDGAAAGQHRAIVVQMIINDGMIKHVKDHGDPVEPMFGSYDSSPLTVVVEAKEQNQIEIVVEKAARK